MLSRSPSSAFYPFLGEGSPTKIGYREKGTPIPTPLLEDLVVSFVVFVFCLLFLLFW